MLLVHGQRSLRVKLPRLELAELLLEQLLSLQ